jgi:hypothetical protein
MKRSLPVWTLTTLGAAVGIDGLIILLRRGPLGCGDSDTGSGLAALFFLIALVLLVAGPSTLIVLGLRDVRAGRPVPAYALIFCGVPLIIALSIWAIGSAFGASSCGSSMIMMGG